MFRRLATSLLTLLFAAPAAAQICPSGPPCVGGPLPGPLPLFPSSNWWNQDISAAPLDPGSAAFITFIGNDALHADFYGEVTPGSVEIYGIPYIVVTGSQPKRTVFFDIWDESDGNGVPFYPIPDEAITQPHWIEQGHPGNQNPGGDRHMLIVDQDNKHLYELYNVFFSGTNWTAYSGAFFDMNTNNRRPETWTSSDAAGLAVLPGLVRYDEACGTAEIDHAFRFTVRATNGYVWPASHRAGSTADALPMGARLRLKASTDISAARFPDPCVRRVFRAMKTHGLIVADNGTDMFVTGTYDPRWPALFDAGFQSQFQTLRATDFEVVKLGWHPISIGDVVLTEGDSGTTNAVFAVTLLAPADQTATVNYATANGTAAAGIDYAATSGTLSFPPGTVTRTITVPVMGDFTFEPNETFFVNLSGAVNADITDGQGEATITNDDPEATISVDDVAVVETSAGTTSATFTVALSNAAAQIVTVNYATANGTATSPADYTATSGLLTFTPGTVTQPVPVTVVGDTVVELDEGFGLNLSGAVGATFADGQGSATILDDDAGSLSSRELSPGAVELQDLAALPGPVANVDHYRVAQSPRSSYEVVVDATSGDVSPLELERLGADNVTVLQSSVAIGTGASRSLRWQNPTPGTVLNQHIRVRSGGGGCTTSCGPDDVYRIRMRETTGAIPRFNNTGSQITVLLLQNTGSDTIGGSIYFWSTGGALLHTQAFSIGPRALYVFNPAGVAALAGKSGAVTVSHDGRYGALAGKAVALEPATGFSFDSPLLFRP